MLVTISVDRPSVGASKAAERSLYVADSELIDPRPRVRLARAFRVRKHPPRGLAVDMAAATLVRHDGVIQHVEHVRKWVRLRASCS